MQRVALHPDRAPDIGPMEQRAVLAALNGQTGCVMRSVVYDENVIYADLRVHTYMTLIGPGFALVAIGRYDYERVILIFDSLREAIEKYLRVVESCERDPLCREGDRLHAWDITDHQQVPCNEAKAA